MVGSEVGRLCCKVMCVLCGLGFGQDREAGGGFFHLSNLV